MTIVLWVVLAAGVAGLSLFLGAVLHRWPTGGSFWLVPAFCLAAVVISTRGILRRQKPDGAQRPRLFISDLLLVSFAVGLYLIVIRAWLPDEFERWGVGSSFGVMAGLLLALLQASRKGYTEGVTRAQFALGRAGLVLGLAALAPTLAVFAFIGVAGSLVSFWALWSSHQDFRMMRVMLYCAAPLIVLGQLLSWQAARRSHPSKPRAPE